ncbi:MAG: regulatory iron-sulfur-containing complex subunit RicT, partial [Thermovirgaceae bacterium]|nr:regulatory iron-sulfur-containing complex subunit RicT [Thermovirgaceae bacterium]
MSSYLMIFGKPRYLGLLENDREEISPGIQLVTESARGEEISLAAGPITPEQAEYYRNDLSTNGGDGAPRGGEPAFQEIRLVRNATEEDLAERKSQAADEEIILVKGRELLKAHPLDMKLVDVEFLLDRKKLFFYFTAEQRIDFRSYVRDLAREFKTRIELRQIGVRDESKVVKGLSPCGMPCCCSYWLNRFAPICIRMVKEQNLALNPTKISGICGRLMCCMGYEHNTYRELWKSLPGPGSKIKTPTSTCIVSGVDVAREKVRVFCPGGGGERLVDINDFQSFRETIMKGETWEKDIDSGVVSLSGIDTGKGPDVLTEGGREDQG